MALKVDDDVVARGESGGLIPKHPQEELSVGFDSGNPVADDVSSQRYRGSISLLQILVDGH